MLNANLLEIATMKVAMDPVDLNTAAVTGARIKLAAGHRLAVVCVMGDSTSATAVTFTLRQHNAASSGTSKDLSVENVYYKKVGAATSFTKVEPTSAAAAYDLTTDFANEPGIVVFEVLAEDLDVNNGFAWVSVDIADAGAAKIASAFYVLHDVKQLPAYEVAV